MFNPPLIETFASCRFADDFELHGPLRDRPDAIVQRLQHSTNCKEHAVLVLEQLLFFVADPDAVLIPHMLDLAALWKGAAPEMIEAHVFARLPIPSEALLRTVLAEGSVVSASGVSTFAADLERFGPALISHCLVFDDLKRRACD